MPKRIRQPNSVTVGHPDSIDRYARELEERGESFHIEEQPEFLPVYIGDDTETWGDEITDER